MKLSNLDRKIISLLEENARMPLTEMAKRLHSSQQVVSYRLKALEKKGIIGEYYTIIDFSKLGYTSYRTLIRLSNADDQIRKKILEYLNKNKNVLWLVEVGGRWDILVNFLARSIIHYNGLLRNLKNSFSEQIQNHDILVTIGGIHLNRDYLSKNKRESESNLFFGIEENSILSLDVLDKKILSALSTNARKNAAEIAAEMKVSPNTAVLRIKNLKKMGIIKGFKPLIHLEKTSYSGYKALIKFQNISEKKEKELIGYAGSMICVIGVLKMVGPWDFEIEFEVENQEKMLSFVRELRDKFQDIIKELEVLPLYHEYKYNFFPGDLLEESNPQ